MLQALEQLEENGFRVLAFISDGAGPNRSFYKMVGSKEHPHIYQNPYSKPSRPIFLIADPPHLIKTIRNCFSNSGSHSHSRYMWKNEQFILWEHVVKAYKADFNSGIRLLHYLTEDHLTLDPFSRMKVKLAVQVLSRRTALAVEKLGGSNCSETVKFLRTFNKFFDLLNVRFPGEGKRTRNEDLEPYTSPDDPRLEWLQKTLLGYLDEWDHEVECRQGPFIPEDREKMKISFQSVEGIHLAVNGIVSAVKFLLAEGAKYVLTGKFNQDILEMEFCKQRMSSGCNKNPDLLGYGQGLAKQRGKSYTIRALKGNITPNSSSS